MDTTFYKRVFVLYLSEKYKFKTIGIITEIYYYFIRSYPYVSLELCIVRIMYR